MVDGDNLFPSQVTDRSGERKFGLLLMFISLAFVLTAVTFEAIREAASTGNVAAGFISLAFTIPLFTSYILYRESMFSSPVREDGLAASYAIPFSLYLLLMGGGFFTLSLFSTATDSYLSLLSGLDQELVNLVNLEYATGIETYFLPAISVSIYPFIRKFVERFGLGNKTAVAISAVPSALGFGFLHGARSISFLLFAGVVMFIWIVSLGWENTGSGDLIPYLPISILSLIGIHRAHNFASAGVGVAEFYFGLLGSGSPLIQGLGVLLLFRDLYFFALTGHWLYRVGGEMFG